SLPSRRRQGRRQGTRSVLQGSISEFVCGGEWVAEVWGVRQHCRTMKRCPFIIVRFLLIAFAAAIVVFARARLASPRLQGAKVLQGVDGLTLSPLGPKSDVNAL